MSNRLPILDNFENVFKTELNNYFSRQRWETKWEQWETKRLSSSFPWRTDKVATESEFQKYSIFKENRFSYSFFAWYFLQNYSLKSKNLIKYSLKNKTE